MLKKKYIIFWRNFSFFFAFVTTAAVLEFVPSIHLCSDNPGASEVQLLNHYPRRVFRPL